MVESSIHIFILCYNESVLLPETIKHYKTMLPSSIITIYDNKSTDKSVKIARDLGCKVISWSSGNKIDDYKYLEIKNNCWKEKKGWVIVCDIDEWLCVTERDLLEEKEKGTTILSIRGYNIYGKSKYINLKDTNLHALKAGHYNKWESKDLCFHLPDIKEINYEMGAHNTHPHGNIKYSSKKYINKHMANLGLAYLTNKMKMRYRRASAMRKKGHATHYTDNSARIKRNYIKEMKKTQKLRCNRHGYCYTRKAKK
jgi:hypothetical protein